MDADYVVVGAGSAGCVIAARLSETGASVTLLEAGPRDWHPMIHIPAGVLKLLHHPAVNWNYSADPGAGSAKGLYPLRELGSDIEALRFYQPLATANSQLSARR